MGPGGDLTADGGETSASGAPVDPAPPAAAAGRGPIEELRRKSARLADVLRTTTPRRDVLATRARLLLLLLAARCPLDALPAKPWYVAGAAARFGAGALERAWGERWPAIAPPSERRIRDHLGELERQLLIVREPGAWLPTLPQPDHPERRYRWPDTIHVLEREEDAEWWGGEGAALLAAHPEARTNPTAWKTHVGAWRQRKKPVQRPLFADPVAHLAEALRWNRKPAAPAPMAQLDDLRTAATLRSAVTAGPVAGSALLHQLERIGVRLNGTNRLLVLRDHDRLAGATALLAVALRRGRTIHNRAGFLVAAWRRAPRTEMVQALQRLVAS